MHIGLIGGIGPAATIAYYDRLTRLARDARRPLELTIVQADSRQMIANLLADRREEQAAVYAMLIARLGAAGADCAAITSMAVTSASPRQNVSRRCRSSVRLRRSTTISSPPVCGVSGSWARRS